MSFGSSAPPTPKAEPVTPVPQEDDPKSAESRRRAAITAGKREGHSAHLLSKPDAKSRDHSTDRKRIG